MTNVTTAVDVLIHARSSWDVLSDDEKHTAVTEALDELTETGERIMESELTDRRYRVTRWIDKGDGKFVALEKEEIED